MQEHNIASVGLPGSSEAARMGWTSLWVPNPTDFCASALLALLELSRHTTVEGQRLSAQVLGLSHQLQASSLYSLPAASPGPLFDQFHELEASSPSPWLLGLDGNISMTSGGWPEAMRLAGGLLRAVARHKRSTYPIDAVWSSDSCPLAPGSAVEMPPVGNDHSKAFCVFNFDLPSAPPEWRLAKTPCDAGPEARAWAFCAASVETWEASLRDIDAAWRLWCRDAQRWLSAGGGLSRPPRRPGTVRPPEQAASSSASAACSHTSSSTTTHAKAAPNSAALTLTTLQHLDQQETTVPSKKGIP